MTRIEYTINGLFAGVDMINRVLTPAEIEKYVRRARREIGAGINHKIWFKETPKSSVSGRN